MYRYRSIILVLVGVCTAATVYEGVIQVINNRREEEAESLPSHKGKHLMTPVTPSGVGSSESRSLLMVGIGYRLVKMGSSQ